MLVAEYDRFVRDTDQYASRSPEDRERIATYGLVGEIGSLLSAVKKQLLMEAGSSAWNQSNEEIVEELGDVIWYCFSLSQVLNNRIGINIFKSNINELKRELNRGSDKSKRIHEELSRGRLSRFLRASDSFPRIKNLRMGDYQRVAFLTARTKGQVLLGVCLGVLWQLGAELLRRKLPDSEIAINRTMGNRNPNKILGEIAWHVAAVASLYRLNLDDVAAENQRKVNFRLNRSAPTPLHDEGYDPAQQFPRKFAISFVTVGEGRARMYLDGRQLGSELTDNSYEGDGYRFHDVMHLANAAKLGWSPVLRSLLNRKRKRDRKVDEVEDGARAQIVEEAVVKVIHSEGTRLARQRDPKGRNRPWRLFSSKDDVNFKFLKLINSFVRGLEVDKNKYWEWEDAIFQGYSIFDSLCREGQGTVHVDLEGRNISFDPEVYVDMPGTIVGMGSSLVEVADYSTIEKRLAARAEWAEFTSEAGNESSSSEEIARIVATKRAVLEAIGMFPGSDEHYSMLQVRFVRYGVTVKAVGRVQEEMWRRGVITFRTTFVERGPIVGCTALAISDPHDAIK